MFLNSGNLVKLIIGKLNGTSIHMLNSDSYILEMLLLAGGRNKQMPVILKADDDYC